MLLQVASGRRDHIKVFGRDYETPDGTCIRDYVHVQDLCYAHLLGLDYLIASGKSNAYNLGNGRGFSVQEVIATVERITGQKIKTEDAPRRAGDPTRLVANSAKAAAILGWKPGYAELDTIVAHAWASEKKLTASAPWLGLPARPGLRF